MAATREFSAGGVIVRRAGDGFELAVIEPRGKPNVRALPKGHIDPGETPEETAVREVREETGLSGKSRGKLGDVKYTYRFEGKSIFKIVSFYLLELESGEIDQLDQAMRIEVEKAFWLPLSRAAKELSYPGERQMAQKALEEVGRWKLRRLKVARSAKYDVVGKLPPGGTGKTAIAVQSGPGGFKRLVVLRPLADSTLIPVANIDPQLPVPHGVVELDGTGFAAYDFFPGATLKEITAIYRGQDQLPPLGLVLRVVIDAARILNVAHTHQDALGGPAPFVHGGLSDSLLLMGFDGLVRVLDFGVRAFNRFSAPEASRGGPFDARSDVFSLAAVLHAALTGFQGSYVQVLQRTPSAAEFPPPSAVHPDAKPDLDVLVMHSLMPERERRLGSLNELANELERLVGAGLPQPQACATRIRQLFEERLDGLRNMVPRLESDVTAQRFRPSRPALPIARRSGEKPKIVAEAFESERDEATIVKVEPPVHVNDLDGPDDSTDVKDERTVALIQAAAAAANAQAAADAAVIDDQMDRFDKTDVVTVTPSMIVKSRPTALQQQYDASELKRTTPHADVPWAPPSPAPPPPPPAPLAPPEQSYPVVESPVAAAPIDDPPTGAMAPIPSPEQLALLKGTSDEERAAALGQELVSTGQLPAVRDVQDVTTGKLPPGVGNLGVIPDVADLKTVVKVTGGHPKVQLALGPGDDTGRVPQLQPRPEPEPRRRSPVPIAIIAILLVGIGGGFGYLAVTRPAMVREKFAAALIKWGLKRPPPPPEAEQAEQPPQEQVVAAAGDAGVDAGAAPAPVAVAAPPVDAGEDEDLDGGEEEEDDAGVGSSAGELSGHDAGATHKKTKHKKHPKAWWQTH